MMEPDRSLSFTSSSLPTSDRDEAMAMEQSQRDQVQQLLDLFGNALDTASHGLDELLEAGNYDLLGNAIVRKCHELADSVGQLATELEDNQEDILQALQQDSFLFLESSSSSTTRTISQDDYSSYEEVSLQAPDDDDDDDDDHLDHDDNHQKQKQQLLNLSKEDWRHALKGAAELLRDVEVAFRDISRSEAEEIADVSLTLARCFLWSLQSFHESITADDVLHQQKQLFHRGGNMNTNHHTTTTVTIEEILDSSSVNPPQSSPTTSFDNHDNQKERSCRYAKQQKRLRVLWPPIGPHVQKACQWGQAAATQRPLLAVALGLTLWPVAIGTAMATSSMVIADHCVQSFYDHVLQEQSWMATVEEGAAQAVQAGKLAFLCSRLVGKQTWRVIERQVERQGGIPTILGHVGHFCIDRALHPIQTVQMAWCGVSWGVGTIHHTIQQMLDQHQDEEKAIALQ